MEELKKALAGVDDDYLVGISNKGIVKRAYKDVDTVKIKADYIDGSAYVTVDNTQCVILTPIAGSSCNCPSRTICRHIITAILWLKKELISEQSEKENVEILESQTKSKENNLAKELAEYPVEKLQKAMKKKYYNAFIEKVKVGILPQMEELSAITVDIPEDNSVVKLISPLEYSACTCHSKELCKHKAAAILAWKIKHKVIELNSLMSIEDGTPSMDIDKLHNCAKNCIEFLERLLSDGLVRTSDDAAEHSETNAVLCHNADIPNGEKIFREIGNRLKGYLAHSPEFNTNRLFSVIIEAYILMIKICKETDVKKLKDLAGEFKSSYQISDELELIPLAQRKISSVTGFEGDVYYFVNKSKSGNKLPFLTFSDIRPTFYESNKRSSTSNAPWGLYGLINVLMSFEMRLTLPKLSGIKLSSSSETRAVQICKPDLNQRAVYDKVYTDFRKLIEDNFEHITDDDDKETLVMLMPQKCVSSDFSEISQTHTIVVEDFYGQCLNVQARYNSKARVFFSQLSVVGKTMIENPEKSYVIFGNAYIEDGQCQIYPIAVFDNLSIPKPQIEKRGNKKHHTYGYFSKLFHEIEEMLCDIIQCGINSFSLYNQIKDMGNECDCSGLTILGKELNNLAESFENKNHTYSDNNTDIIELVCGIYSYLRLAIEKTEIKCAINNLYESGENADEFVD